MLFLIFKKSIYKNFNLIRDYHIYLESQKKYVSQAVCFAPSIDYQSLTRKIAIVFWDATHASAITKILSQEMGISVVWLGTYCIYDTECFTKEVTPFSDQAIVAYDHELVADFII